jgi:hypothetical protein
MTVGQALFWLPVALLAVAASACFLRLRTVNGHLEVRRGRSLAASARAFDAAFDVEIERARRYERPLALIRIESRGDRRGAAALDPMVARRTDLVFAVGAATYLIAPETTSSRADALCRRVEEEHGAAELVSATSVSFPCDGLSRGALLTALDGGGAPASPPSQPQPSQPQPSQPEAGDVEHRPAGGLEHLRPRKDS